MSLSIFALLFALFGFHHGAMHPADTGGIVPVMSAQPADTGGIVPVN